MVMKIFDANAQAAADDERTTFYLEQLEKELSGSFWALEEEANARWTQPQNSTHNVNFLT
jgi:hypothetical protein